ncbi:MAG: ACP S-malonyltransferase [Solirubrobacterales bacterium]
MHDGPPTDAILFPGQGSQTPGMRRIVEAFRPDLLPLAERAVGADPFERIEEGTRYTQPAIFCAAVAGWSAIEADLSPLAMGGHSLGEIAALVAAGALSAADGILLIAERGRLMQEAAEANGDGGMAAVLGEPREAVEEVAAAHDLVLANDNSPTQVVLSGPSRALAGAEEALRERGLRVMPLAVRGAFHTPAMEPAARAFGEVLAGVEFAQPEVPVYSCVTARPFTDPRSELARSLTDQVRWLEVMEALQASGATRFVETGPGKVLSRLVRRTLKGVEALAPVEEVLAGA